MRGGARGFTLLELTVAFAISTLVLLMAGRLLLESQARLQHAARQALDPVASAAVDQIRADVRSAAGEASGAGVLWSWDPLVLTGHPAGQVIYEKIDSDLVRRVVPLDPGAEASERPVLRGVEIWRWRRHPETIQPALEIDLAYDETAQWGAVTAAGQRSASPPVRRFERMVVLPRNGGRDESEW